MDILLTVPRYPKPGFKINATGAIIQGGGPVPNALVGLARMGAITAFIAVFGDDPIGTMGRNELESEGVDMRFAIIKRQPSALATGFIEQGSGRRTIALERQIHVLPRDLDLTRYPLPRIIHLDGRDLAACIKLARWGKKVGATISFDIGSIRNDVHEIFPLVDDLVVADAYAFPFTGAKNAKNAIKRLSDHRPGTIVVTEGLRGSTGWEGGQFIRQPAYRVKNVDTTGAGDSFHAGYLYGVLKGWGLAERLQFGAATAALKCTKPGARTGAPDLKSTRQFLKGKPTTYA
jgi:sulfofructose kinase